MLGVVTYAKDSDKGACQKWHKSGGGDIAHKSRRAPDPLKYVGCVASGRAPVWIRIEAGADEIFEFWVLVRHFPAEVLKSADWEISRRSRDNLVDN